MHQEASNEPPRTYMASSSSTSASKGDNTESLTCYLVPKTLTVDPDIPKDFFHLAYMVYFILGAGFILPWNAAGFILPWNAFVTAVDYFSYLYPDSSVDRVFAVVYMIISLIGLVVVLSTAHKSTPLARINVGLSLFVVALLVVPIMDVCCVKGRVGVYEGYYVTVCLLGFCGISNALVQGCIIGSAGEFPERYMQAVVAGTGASGVLVAVLRLLTKAVYPQDTRGLRNSANLYFIVAIIMMLLSITSYNMGHKLEVIQFYNKLKNRAMNEEKGSTIWETVGAIKWYAFSSSMICIVTIYVHSKIFKDWYGIILITGFNIFDFIGKCLTSVCIIEDAKVVIGGSFARLLFLPLFYVCMHGPEFFRSEIPVSVLTCILGFTNGYFSSFLLISGPKALQLQRAETAGIVLVFFFDDWSGHWLGCFLVLDHLVRFSSSQIFWDYVSRRKL